VPEFVQPVHVDEEEPVHALRRVVHVGGQYATEAVHEGGLLNFGQKRGDRGARSTAREQLWEKRRMTTTRGEIVSWPLLAVSGTNARLSQSVARCGSHEWLWVVLKRVPDCVARAAVAVIGVSIARSSTEGGCCGGGCWF